VCVCKLLLWWSDPLLVWVSYTEHASTAKSCYLLLSPRNNKTLLQLNRTSCAYIRTRSKKIIKRKSKQQGKDCLVGGVYMEYIPPTMQCRPRISSIHSVFVKLNNLLYVWTISFVLVVELLRTDSQLIVFSLANYSL
jgi:hypothetical protein